MWNATLARSLAALPGNRVHVLTTGSGLDRDLTLRIGQLTLHVLAIPARLRLLSLTRVVKWRFHARLRQLQPDIVHGIGTEHEYPYIAATYPAAHLITIQVVLDHLLDQGQMGFARSMRLRLFRQLQHVVFKQTRHMTVSTPAVRRAIPLQAGHRIHIVPNAVDPLFFDTRRERRQQGPFSVLYVGRISPEKGLFDLIDGAGDLVRQGYDVALTLVGKTDDRVYARRLEDRIHSHQLDSRVVKLAPQPAATIARLMSEHDALILPSYYEAFGLVLAEAMAVGCPVLASRVGGIPDVIRENETGRLFTAGDASSIARCLKLTIDDPDAREQMARTGRQMTRHRFHPSVISRQVQRIYQTVLDPVEHERVTQPGIV
jgi:glycosyltransferase involved in cell wall biosynthesis